MGIRPATSSAESKVECGIIKKAEVRRKEPECGHVELRVTRLALLVTRNPVDGPGAVSDFCQMPGMGLKLVRKGKDRKQKTGAWPVKV